MVLALQPNWWMPRLSLRLPLAYADSHWVLTGTLCQYKLHTFLEQELCALNCRMDGDVEALIGLPGQEHFGPGILGVVTRSVLSACPPRLQD